MQAVMGIWVRKCVLKQLSAELHFDFCVTRLHVWTDTKLIVSCLRCAVMINTNVKCLLHIRLHTHGLSALYDSLIYS